MPLIKSGSKQAVSTNIREMMASGYPQKQAVAAALSTARRYGKKYADGGEIDPMTGNPALGEGEAQKKFNTILNRTIAGAKHGWGDRELGFPKDQQFINPGLQVAQPYMAAGDAALRAPGAILHGAAGLAGGLYQAATGDEAWSKRLERDMGILGQGAMVEAGMGPKMAPTGLTAGSKAKVAAEGAGEALDKGVAAMPEGVGVFGGKLKQPEPALAPPDTGIGSHDWFAGQFKDVLQGSKPSPEFNSALEQSFKAHSPEEWSKIAGDELAQADKFLKSKGYSTSELTDQQKLSELRWWQEKFPEEFPANAKHTPEEWDKITKAEQEAKGPVGIPVHKAITDTMFADLVDGTKPKDVAKYLVEFAKEAPDIAIMAKDNLPKQAKSDINKALWALTKDKNMTKADKEIINNLYSSKAKLKAEPKPDPFEQVPYPYTSEEWAKFSKSEKDKILANPERGGTQGTTPDEIAEYYANQDAHAAGPQWEAPIEKNARPHPNAKPGDPVLDFTNNLFEEHTSPFPERIPITPEKKAKAQEWWGDTQEAWHASSAGWENWHGKTLLLPEEIPHKDRWGNVFYKEPEIGIHSGTNKAAHTRIGPYNPKYWDESTPGIGQPHVMPIIMKHERPLQLPDLGSWTVDNMAHGLRNHTNIPHDEIAAAMSNKLSAGSQARKVAQMNNLRKLLDDHGYDSIRYINNVEDPGSVSFITWHKKNIRNAWAAFKDKSAEDLTAGIAAGAILYPYLRGTENENGMKKGGRTMAAGGFNPSKWIPRPQPGAHTGMIRSAIPGRTDKIPMNVKGGSYVIPADVVSGIGQGNSMAGAAAFNNLFGQGPYGSKMASVRGMGKPNFGKPMRMPMPMQRLKMSQAATGGAEDGEDHVPIIAAGGEFVISPEVVKRIGGGDMKHGHEILDELVLHLRKKTIHEMRKLKPPKK